MGISKVWHTRSLMGITAVSCRAFALVSIATLFVLVAGCATPTYEEIDEHYDRRVEELEKAYDRYVEGCAGATNPQACIEGAIAWRAQMYLLLEQMRDAAHTANWQHLRDRQKAWEDALRELFPDWPDLKDIVIPIIGATVTIDISGVPDPERDPCEVIVTAMRKYKGDFDQVNLVEFPQLRRLIAESPCFDIMVDGQGQQTAQALDAQGLDMSGTVTVDLGGVSTVITLSGSLDLAGAEAWDGSYSGTVFGGTLAATLSTGGSALLEVVPDEANLLETGTNHAGTLTVLFDATYSNEGWDAILQNLTRLRIPITRSAIGTIDSTLGPTSIEDVIPYSPHPLSDYNDDGVLDLATDLAAFQADLVAQAYLTDINEDGVWDSVDTDLWTDDFFEDLSHQ